MTWIEILHRFRTQCTEYIDAVYNEREKINERKVMPLMGGWESHFVAIRTLLQ